MNNKPILIAYFSRSGNNYVNGSIVNLPGMGSSERDIKKLCPDAKLQKGLAIRGGSVKGAGKDIEAWLKKNGIL